MGYSSLAAQRAADVLLSKLPGPSNIRTRQLYRAIEKHYHEANCNMCSFYPKYGAMIVKGTLFEHIADITGGKLNPEDIRLIEASGLIERTAISTRQHRISFMLHEPEELLA